MYLSVKPSAARLRHWREAGSQHMSHMHFSGTEFLEPYPFRAVKYLRNMTSALETIDRVYANGVQWAINHFYRLRSKLPFSCVASWIQLAGDGLSRKTRLHQRDLLRRDLMSLCDSREACRVATDIEALAYNQFIERKVQEYQRLHSMSFAEHYAVYQA